MADEAFNAAVDITLTKTGTDAELSSTIAAAEGSTSEAVLIAASAAQLKKDAAGAAVATAKAAVAATGSLPSMLAASRALVGAGAFIEGMQMASEALRGFKAKGDKSGEASALYALAQAYLAKSCPEDAFVKALEAGKLYKEAKSRVGEASAKIALAAAQYAMKDYDKALKTALDAVSIAGEINDGLKGGRALLLQAQINLSKGEPDDALDAAKDAMDRAKELKEVKLEIAVSDINIACYMAKAQPEEALIQIQMLMERQRQLGDKAGETKTLLRKAQFQIDNGETDNAKSTATEAQGIFAAAGDALGQAEASAIIVECLLAADEYKEVFPMSDKTYPLFEGLDYSNKAVESAFLKLIEGVINAHVSSGNFQGAFQTAFGAMSTCQSRKQKKGEASLQMTLSDLNLAIEPPNFDGALQAIVLSPGIFASVGDTAGEATAKGKLAKIYFMKAKGTVSLKAAEDAVAGFRKVGDMAMLAGALESVAQAHLLLASKGAGNGLEASRAAQEALSIYRSAKDKTAEAGALILTGHAQLLTRNFREAKEAGSQAETLYRDMESNVGEASAMMIVAAGFLGLGDFEEARRVGKEARDLFQGVEDAAGEDSIEDFLETMKSYEKGEKDLRKFVGFGMKGGDSKGGKKEKKKKPKEMDDTDATLFEMAKNQVGREVMKQCTVAFESFETRRATAPGTTTGRKKASEATDAVDEEFTVAPKKDAALFVVKWVADAQLESRGAEYAPGAENISQKKVASTTIPLPMDIGAPKSSYLRCGTSMKANKMLEALGKKKGVLA